MTAEEIKKDAMSRALAAMNILLVPHPSEDAVIQD